MAKKYELLLNDRESQGRNCTLPAKSVQRSKAMNIPSQHAKTSWMI